MNPFNIRHDLNTSYNNEINPLVFGFQEEAMDQELLREAIANDCWDYEDTQRWQNYSELEAEVSDEQWAALEDFDFYKS